MEKTTGLDAAVPLLGEDWFDPLEAGVRQQIRSFIEQMLEAELEAALNRRRYERDGSAAGHRHSCPPSAAGSLGVGDTGSRKRCATPGHRTPHRRADPDR